MSAASDKKDAAVAADTKKAVAAASSKAGVTSKTGTPADPTDHSIGGKKEEVAPVTPLAAKIAKSELYAVNDHPNGGGLYVGISPQNDPKASEPSKRLSSVNTLLVVPPRTGMQVRPKDGDAFAIGEGFNQDSTPADWQRVAKPDGSLLFA